jgi:hypothetical protein
MKIDFLRKVLFEHEESMRQTGRTTHLVDIALKSDAVIVCHNFSWANRLQKDYGVKAITLDTYLNPDYHRGRKKTQYLFDSPAEIQIIQMKFEEAEKIIAGEVY